MTKSVFLTLVFVVFVVVSTTNSVYAQDSFDKLTMLNGEEHIGKVIGLDNETIKFVHKNETLEYSYDKVDINKIQFSSGRIEILNKVAKGSGNAGALQDHHNVVAILPFTYLGSNGAHDDAMEKKVQSDCYNLLNKFADQFKLQDPVTTNALLIKHGVSSENIDGFIPEELCNMLGAEYIVMGTVSVLYTNTTNYSGSTQTSKKDGNKDKKYTSTTSSSTDNYRTEVDMKMYTDQGNNVYAKSHTSFWQTEDAYTVTLQWLIKRSPLFLK